MQPGMQAGMHGMSGMPGVGTINNPYMGNPTPIPFLQPPAYDNLTPKGRAKDFKEGGSAVKFDTFTGVQDRQKALIFLQQFDAAYSGGNFTESSKVRKAATFLKGNALQWWTNMLLQGRAPTTWVEFKQVFSATWLTTTFEMDVMTAWHKLDAAHCANLEEYNNKF